MTSQIKSHVEYLIPSGNIYFEEKHNLIGRPYGLWCDLMI